MAQARPSFGPTGRHDEAELEGFRQLGAQLLTWPGYATRPIEVVDAPSFTNEWVRTTGLQAPSLVRGYTSYASFLQPLLQDMRDLVLLAKELGDDREVQTLDVAKQTLGPKWTMRQWCLYWKERQALGLDPLHPQQQGNAPGPGGPGSGRPRHGPLDAHVRGSAAPAAAVSGSLDEGANTEIDDEADSAFVHQGDVDQFRETSAPRKGIRDSNKRRLLALTCLSLTDLPAAAPASGQLRVPPPLAAADLVAHLGLAREVAAAAGGGGSGGAVTAAARHHLAVWPAGAAANFRLLPGGAASWWGVAHGRMVFLLLPPTEQDLALFASWTSSGAKEHGAPLLDAFASAATAAAAPHGSTSAAAAGPHYHPAASSPREAAATSARPMDFSFHAPTAAGPTTATAATTAAAAAGWQGLPVSSLGRVVRLEAGPGELAILPAGWPFAVVAGTDSVAVCGQMLHVHGLAAALRSWEVEELLKVKQRARFPLFRHIMWHAALSYGRTLRQAAGLPMLKRQRATNSRDRDRGGGVLGAPTVTVSHNACGGSGGGARHLLAPQPQDSVNIGSTVSGPGTAAAAMAAAMAGADRGGGGPGSRAMAAGPAGKSAVAGRKRPAGSQYADSSRRQSNGDGGTGPALGVAAALLPPRGGAALSGGGAPVRGASPQSPQQSGGGGGGGAAGSGGGKRLRANTGAVVRLYNRLVSDDDVATATSPRERLGAVRPRSGSGAGAAACPSSGLGGGGRGGDTQQQPPPSGGGRLGGTARRSLDGVVAGVTPPAAAGSARRLPTRAAAHRFMGQSAVARRWGMDMDEDEGCWDEDMAGRGRAGGAGDRVGAVGGSRRARAAVDERPKRRAARGQNWRHLLADGEEEEEGEEEANDANAGWAYGVGEADSARAPDGMEEDGVLHAGGGGDVAARAPPSWRTGGAAARRGRGRRRGGDSDDADYEYEGSDAEYRSDSLPYGSAGAARTPRGTGRVSDDGSEGSTPAVPGRPRGRAGRGARGRGFSPGSRAGGGGVLPGPPGGRARRVVRHATPSLDIGVVNSRPHQQHQQQSGRARPVQKVRAEAEAEEDEEKRPQMAAGRQRRRTPGQILRDGLGLSDDDGVAGGSGRNAGGGARGVRRRSCVYDDTDDDMFADDAMSGGSQGGGGAGGSSGGAAAGSGHGHGQRQPAVQHEDAQLEDSLSSEEGRSGDRPLRQQGQQQGWQRRRRRQRPSDEAEEGAGGGCPGAVEAPASDASDSVDAAAKAARGVRRRRRAVVADEEDEQAPPPQAVRPLQPHAAVAATAAGGGPVKIKLSLHPRAGGVLASAPLPPPAPAPPHRALSPPACAAVMKAFPADHGTTAGGGGIPGIGPSLGFAIPSAGAGVGAGSGVGRAGGAVPGLGPGHGVVHANAHGLKLRLKLPGGQGGAARGGGCGDGGGGSTAVGPTVGNAPAVPGVPPTASGAREGHGLGHGLGAAAAPVGSNATCVAVPGHPDTNTSNTRLGGSQSLHSHAAAHLTTEPLGRAPVPALASPLHLRVPAAHGPPAVPESHVVPEPYGTAAEAIPQLDGAGDDGDYDDFGDTVAPGGAQLHLQHAAYSAQPYTLSSTAAAGDLAGAASVVGYGAAAAAGLPRPVAEAVLSSGRVVPSGSTELMDMDRDGDGSGAGAAAGAGTVGTAPSAAAEAGAAATAPPAPLLLPLAVAQQPLMHGHLSILHQLPASSSGASGSGGSHQSPHYAPPHSHQFQHPSHASGPYNHQQQHNQQHNQQQQQRSAPPSQTPLPPAQSHSLPHHHHHQQQQNNQHASHGPPHPSHSRPAPPGHLAVAVGAAAPKDISPAAATGTMPPTTEPAMGAAAILASPPAGRHRRCSADGHRPAGPAGGALKPTAAAAKSPFALQPPQAAAVHSADTSQHPNALEPGAVDGQTGGASALQHDSPPLSSQVMQTPLPTTAPTGVVAAAAAGAHPAAPTLGVGVAVVGTGLGASAAVGAVELNAANGLADTSPGTGCGPQSLCRGTPTGPSPLPLGGPRGAPTGAVPAKRTFDGTPKAAGLRSAPARPHSVKSLSDAVPDAQKAVGLVPLGAHRTAQQQTAPKGSLTRMMPSRPGQQHRPSGGGLQATAKQQQQQQPGWASPTGASAGPALRGPGAPGVAARAAGAVGPMSPDAVAAGSGTGAGAGLRTSGVDSGRGAPSLGRAQPLSYSQPQPHLHAAQAAEPQQGPEVHVGVVVAQQQQQLLQQQRAGDVGGVGGGADVAPLGPDDAPEAPAGWPQVAAAAPSDLPGPDIAAQDAAPAEPATAMQLAIRTAISGVLQRYDMPPPSTTPPAAAAAAAANGTLAPPPSVPASGAGAAAAAVSALIGSPTAPAVMPAAAGAGATVAAVTAPLASSAGGSAAPAAKPRPSLSLSRVLSSWEIRDLPMLIAALRHGLAESPFPDDVPYTVRDPEHVLEQLEEALVVLEHPAYMPASQPPPMAQPPHAPAPAGPSVVAAAALTSATHGRVDPAFGHSAAEGEGGPAPTPPVGGPGCTPSGAMGPPPPAPSSFHRGPGPGLGPGPGSGLGSGLTTAPGGSRTPPAPAPVLHHPPAHLPMLRPPAAPPSAAPPSSAPAPAAAAAPFALSAPCPVPVRFATDAELPAGWRKLREQLAAQRAHSPGPGSTANCTTFEGDTVEQTAETDPANGSMGVGVGAVGMGVGMPPLRSSGRAGVGRPVSKKLAKKIKDLGL